MGNDLDLKRNYIEMSLIKSTAILFLLFLAGCRSLTVVELDYGVSNAKRLYQTTMVNSPSGHHNTTEDSLTIVRTTDSIKTELGAQFGVAYKILCPETKTVIATITWEFPNGVTDVNGKPISSLTYDIEETTNLYTYSNYTLDGQNEVVKGDWTFIVSVHNKQLYKRVFHLI